MSKLQVSSGRWVAGFGHQHAFRLYQGSLDGPMIANFNCPGGVATGLEAQANLTLCAAAKKMYEALEELTDALSIWEGEGTLPKEWEKLLSDAVDTLREARGEK